ncbi:hypothetical protein SprV_0401477000 [Sparganum proliferum]
MAGVICRALFEEIRGPVLNARAFMVGEDSQEYTLNNLFADLVVDAHQYLGYARPVEVLRHPSQVQRHRVGQRTVSVQQLIPSP